MAAGCFGAPAKAPDAVKPQATNATPPTFALPDARGVSNAANETNKTEAGAGGVQHMHDYWGGKNDVVVFQGDVGPALFPFFPEGEGSTPKGVTYITLPRGTPSSGPKLVYEGATRVSFLVQAPKLRGQENPAPPGVTFSYRTAADSAWRSGPTLTYGKPVEIAVKPDETDMPHSTQTLWNFRLLFDRPSVNDVVNVTLTVHRGGDVVNWPGHPDFYPDNRTERVVFDGDVKTHVYGFPLDGFYEGTEAWFPPKKLISYGTGSLDVYVNVSSFASAPPIPATKYVLYVHNATQLGIGCCDGGTWQDAEGKNDLKTYHFHLNVTPDGMDGPYQPGSRWGFHLAAVTAAFTDSTSYDVEYHITIIARKAENAAPMAM